MKRLVKSPNSERLSELLELEWPELAVPRLSNAVQRKRLMELLHPSAQNTLYWVHFNIEVPVESYFANDLSHVALLVLLLFEVA